MVEAQVLIDVAGCNLAGTDSLDNSGRAALAVAANEHAGQPGRFKLAVGNELAPVGFHAERREGLGYDVLANSDKDHIGRDAALGLGSGNRGRAAALHRADHLRLSDERGAVPRLVHFHGSRSFQNGHFHAFCHSRFDFLVQRSHVGLTATVRNGYRSCAGAHGGAGAVHGNVAAADDHHVLAREVGILVVADLPQQLYGAVNAFGIGIVQAKRLAGMGADGHIDGIVLVGDAAHGGFVYIGVVLNLDVAH